MARLCFIDWDHQRLTALVADCGRNRAKILDSWSEETDLSPNPVMAEELGNLLKSRLREKKYSVIGIVALVGRDRLVVRDQKYPAVSQAEEPGLVRLLTTKEILDDPNDVIIDYQPWTSQDSKSEQRALVYVLRREMMTTYENIAKGAGAKLLGLCPRAMGLAAAMPSGSGTRGLVAVGSGWRQLLVVQDGAVELDRGLALGETMAQEARRGFAVFGTTGGANPGRIFAAGANLQEIDRLGESLELAVEELEAVDGPVKAGPGAASLIALSGMAKAWSRELPGVDFVHPRMPRSEISDTRKRLYLYGGAAAVLLAMIGAAFWWHTGRKESDISRMQADLDKLKQENLRFVEDEKRLKELATWDTANWLEELVDLACRVPDTKKLLVTEIVATPQQQVAGQVSPYTGRLNIKGILPEGTGDENELERLDKEMRNVGPEGYYLTKLRRTGKTFDFEVLVKTRSPADYQLIPPPPKKKDTKAEPKAEGKLESKALEPGKVEQPPFAKGKGGSLNPAQNSEQEGKREPRAVPGPTEKGKNKE